MTISPPSNVKGTDPTPRVLAHGIDSLVVSLDVLWDNDATFRLLTELQRDAAEQAEELPGRVECADGTGPWVFNLLPYGAGGYAWLMSSHALMLKVMHKPEPTSRPNVVAEFRSEALWTHGPAAMVDRVQSILAACGARVVTMKASRVDVAVDVLVPESVWHLGLLDHFVTRASARVPHLHHQQLQGFSLGKGATSARLYDKPLEIAQKSGKVWMFDVWSLDAVPDGCRVIRVELQLRRESIKQLGLSTPADVFAALPNLWAYGTAKWLRVVDDASKHHTQQTVEPWWTIVQAGVTGAQDAHPLIRVKAVEHDRRKLLQQLRGYVTSLIALELGGEMIGDREVLDAESHLAIVFEGLRREGWDDEAFTDDVKRKQAKHMRADEAFMQADRAREAAGLSFNR